MGKTKEEKAKQKKEQEKKSQPIVSAPGISVSPKELQETMGRLQSAPSGTGGGQKGAPPSVQTSLPPKPTGGAPKPPSSVAGSSGTQSSLPPKPTGEAPKPPSSVAGSSGSQSSLPPKPTGEAPKPPTTATTSSSPTPPDAATSKFPILNQIQKNEKLSKLYRISLLALRYQNAPQSEKKGKTDKASDAADKYLLEEYPTVDTTETVMGLSSGITELSKSGVANTSALEGGGMESKGVEATSFIGSLIGCAKNVFGAVKGVIGFVKNRKKDELDYGSSRNDALGFLENCIGAISTGYSTVLSIIKMAGGVLARGVPLVGAILGVVTSAFSLALKIKKYVETSRTFYKLSKRLKDSKATKKTSSSKSMSTTVNSREQLLVEQQYTLKKRFTRLSIELGLDASNIITDIIGIFPGFGTVTSIVGSGATTLTKIGMLATRKIKDKVHGKRTQAKELGRKNAAAFMLGELESFANVLMGYNKDAPLTSDDTKIIEERGTPVKEDIQGTGAKLKSLLLISTKDELAEKLSSAMSTGG